MGNSMLEEARYSAGFTEFLIVISYEYNTFYALSGVILVQFTVGKKIAW